MDKRPKRSSILEKDYRERKSKRRRSSDKSITKDITNDVNDGPRQHDLIQQLYKDILKLKDPEDNEYEICTLFLELPSEEEYPDYYETIQHPIALDDMKAKMDTREYKSLSQFKADIDLMVSNAKTYNLKESQVYGDAVMIQKFVKNWQPPKEKAVLKLPGEAFNKSSSQNIKSIRLRAVDKQKPKSTNIKALMQAIMKKDQKKSMEILENDQDIDPNELVSVEMFKDKFTWSPLHAASYYGDVKLIEALMERGANVEINDTWYSATPLGWAAYGDREKACKLLIQKFNANVNAENVHGQTPFDVVPDQEDAKWIGLFVDPPKTKLQHSQAQKLQKPQLPAQVVLHQRLLEDKNSLQQQQQQQQLQQQQQQQHIKHTPGIHLGVAPLQPPSYNSMDGQLMRKRRGRPPKSETEEANARPTTEIDINTFDPVAYEIELFNAIRTHTDNTNRLYSEQFEDLPDRIEYPEYYSSIKHPISLTEIAEKMQRRMYPNLYAWEKDMKRVFENALSFNEPGSRIFRDAKLLLRLFLRLRERILARLGVPVSQEDDVFRLSLNSRPFDAESITEDKRKRFLHINKSRTQSMEPDQAYSMPNAYTMPQHPLLPQHLLQHQQQQLYQQQLLQQQQRQIINTVPPTMQDPQTIQLQQLNMLPVSLTPQVNMPVMMGHQPPNLSMNAFNNPSANVAAATAAAVAAVSAAAATANNVGHSPTIYSPFSENNNPAPHVPLPKASKEFYALCQDSMGIFINELKITSPNEVYEITVDGEYLNHSLSVPSSVETLVIEPDIAKPLKTEEKRLNVVIVHNNVKLNTSSLFQWETVSLTRGINVIKINVTANLSKPESNAPEYKSKVYQLFITRNW